MSEGVRTTVKDLRETQRALEQIVRGIKTGTATLVAGVTSTVTISATWVRDDTPIFLCRTVTGANAGWLNTGTRTAGTSFTITSSDAADDSTVAWLAITL